MVKSGDLMGCAAVNDPYVCCLSDFTLLRYAAYNAAMAGSCLLHLAPGASY